MFCDDRKCSCWFCRIWWCYLITFYIWCTLIYEYLYSPPFFKIVVLCLKTGTISCAFIPYLFANLFSLMFLVSFLEKCCWYNNHIVEIFFAILKVIHDWFWRLLSQMKTVMQLLRVYNFHLIPSCDNALAQTLQCLQHWTWHVKKRIVCYF